MKICMSIYSYFLTNISTVFFNNKKFDNKEVELLRWINKMNKILILKILLRLIKNLSKNKMFSVYLIYSILDNPL